MEDRALGIVMRVRPLTESSLIVHWLTDRHGRIATVAKGARRLKSPFRGKLDLFFEGSMSFYRGSKSDLFPLREVVVLTTFPGLRNDWSLLHQAAYATRLIEKLTEPATPLDGMYSLLKGFLTHIESHPRSTLPLLLFESHLLRELGLDPVQAASTLSTGTRTLWQRALSMAWEPLATLRPSPVQFQEMRRRLGSLLTDHLGYAPPGRDKAMDIPHN